MTPVAWKVVASLAAAVVAFFALRVFGWFFTTVAGDFVGAVVAAVLVWKFVAVWELRKALDAAKTVVRKV